MKRAVIAVCCALTSLSSFAGDWISGGFGENFDQLVDYSSIEKTGDVRGVWTISIYNRDKDGVAYSLIWREYNCQTKKIRYVDYVDYDFSGQSVNSGTGDGAWSRVIPGSVGEVALNAICKKQKPKVIFPNTGPREVADDVRKFRTSKGDWK